MRPVKFTLSGQPRLRSLDPSAQTAAASLDSVRVLRAKGGSNLRNVENEQREQVAAKERANSTGEQLASHGGPPVEASDPQRMTASDLKKVLDSTDVATILLDTDLNIRFFTPPARQSFNVTAGYIGRSLDGLSSLAADGTLVSDAGKVLLTLEPIEREIEIRSGVWYLRRLLPYRNERGGNEGIVITFTDITRQKEATAALELARMRADAANVAKSRFLAAASHDLRQPLQTLVLLQELLAKVVIDDKAKKLVARLDQTISGMSGMLNALLDINQIEAGTVRAELETFRIDAVLSRVTADLAYQAEAQRIGLRVMPSAYSVCSDPRLLEQMIRNLVSNALKYTKRGRVLVGCRRRNGTVCIEIWDTGVGIPEEQLQDIFEEYHQLDNPARDRSLGLGLGLSIVRRLGILLGHPVRVRSRLGKGSVFSIEVRQSSGEMLACAEGNLPGVRNEPHHPRRARTVLIVEDDPEVRNLLQIGLGAEGHQVATANDGIEALNLIERDGLLPTLVISDFNLPNGMDGLCIAAKIRARLRRAVPVIILTGDISTKTLRDIAAQNCEHLNKPASLKELLAAIERLAAASNFPEIRVATLVGTAGKMPPVVYVVDDDDDVRHTIRSMLEHEGRVVEDYEDGEAFLNAYHPGRDGCLLIDANLPGMSGLDLLKRLKYAGCSVPAIMITGQSDVPMAVEAMKAGAVDFLEKPIRGVELLTGVGRALDSSRDSAKLAGWRKDAIEHLACLTVRQRQILEMVLAGHPSKNIAADLGISQRTVENHRASIMKKAGVRSLPALARLALAAAGALVTDRSTLTASGALAA